MVICMINDNFYRSSGAAIAIRRISLALSDVDYCVAGCENEGLPEDLTWIPAGKYLQDHFRCAGTHQFVRIRVPANDPPAEIIIGRSINRSARGLRESAEHLGGHK